MSLTQVAAHNTGKREEIGQKGAAAAATTTDDDFATYLAKRKAAEEGRVWQPPGGEAAAPPAQIQSNLKEMPTADAAAAAARSRRDPHQDSVMVGKGEWVAIFDPRMGLFITANCK